jgi:hypothetical protein
MCVHRYESTRQGAAPYAMRLRLFSWGLRHEQYNFAEERPIFLKIFEKARKICIKICEKMKKNLRE